MWKTGLAAAAAILIAGGSANAATVIDLTVGGPNEPVVVIDAVGIGDLTVTAGSEVVGATPNVFTNGTQGLGVGGAPEGRRIAQEASTGFNEFLNFDFGQNVFVSAIEIFSTDGDPNTFTFESLGLLAASVDLSTPDIGDDNSDQFTVFNTVDGIGFVGSQFRLTGTTPSGGGARGVMISSITVEQVPLPGGLFLVLSGLAGLGIVGRRRISAT